MAEPIEIIIRQGGQGGIGFGSGNGGAVGGSGNGSTRGATTGLLKGSRDVGQDLLGKIDAVDSQLINYMVGQTKAAISRSISMYGTRTGDYIGQRNIQNALSIAGDLASLGISAWKYQWAGVAIWGVSKTIDIVSQIDNYNINVSKQNITAEFNRQRAGSSLVSGSRGTYE